MAGVLGSSPWWMVRSFASATARGTSPDESLVNANKAVAVAQMLHPRTEPSGCSIKAISRQLTSNNAAELIDGRDLVVDATANGRVLALLEAIATKPPPLSVSCAPPRRGRCAL